VVCSVGTIAAEGSVTVIPFTNTYTAANEVQTSELFVLESDDWLWKVMIVVGSDRNMFAVGFYPAAAVLTTDVNYIGEYSSAEFFVAGPPNTVAITGSMAFDIVGVVANDFIIGATGVSSKLSCTLAGASA